MTTGEGQGAGTEGASNDGGQQAGGEGGERSFRAIESQEDLDRIVQQRLQRERAKFADYDALKEKASKLDSLEEAAKTEAQRATERAAALEAENTQAKLTAARLEVALEKGLTAVQARRLVGATKEELAADADELLASFKPANDDSNDTTPADRPKERLRGGSDPTSDVEETDPRKLAQGVAVY